MAKIALKIVFRLKRFSHKVDPPGAKPRGKLRFQWARQSRSSFDTFQVIDCLLAIEFMEWEPLGDIIVSPIL